jgi:nitroimidazol reductase NimA-like FMN-containing flavoprotein (pyridoxamine 5'-phosphate oxidase superfamily)
MAIAPALSRARAVLRENTYFALATVDATGPWVATLAYTAVAPCYLYFFSEETSRHGAALAGGATVAGVIYDSRCTPAEAESLQFNGRGEMAHERAQIAEVLRLAAQREGEAAPTVQQIDEAVAKTSTRLFRILVEEAYVLDQELFARQGVDGREAVDVKEVFAGALGVA